MPASKTTSPSMTSAELATIGRAVRLYQPKLVANLEAEGYKAEGNDRQLAIYVLRSLGDWESSYAAANVS